MAQFKKGSSGNLKGRPRMPKELLDFKKTSYQDFLTQLQKYGSMPKIHLIEDLKRPDTTMFELIFGNIVLSASRGDRDARRELLDRLWGKPKDIVDEKTESTAPQVIITLPDNGRSVLNTKDNK